MQVKSPSIAARSTIVKPSGSLHPRVQKVGPEHFGIVAVDCAKARSKWMLADFYGRILIPPTVVEHNKQGFDSAIAEIRRDGIPQPWRYARGHRADGHLPSAS